MTAHLAAPALLAFDTSTEQMAVAACGPRGVVALNLPGGAAASAQLLPQIARVLAEAGLSMHELAAIAFGSGPGAFTGLRTSCAVAQGLGLGLARPLLPLDSLLVVAEDAWGTTFERGTHAALPNGEATGAAVRVAVAMDARMDEIYGAVYERRASRVGLRAQAGAGAVSEVGAEVGEEVGSDARAQTGAEAATSTRAPAAWHTVRAPALYALAAWNEVVAAEAALLHGLAGTALAAFGARLQLPTGLPVQPTEDNRAAALLRLAQQAFAAGAAVQADAALPLYLRDKVAQTTAERAAAKAAAQPPVGARAEFVRGDAAGATTGAKTGAAAGAT